MANGSVGRATSVLEKGLEFVNKRNNAFYRYQLYEKLSEAYELAGRPQRALDYYKNIMPNSTASSISAASGRSTNFACNMNPKNRKRSCAERNWTCCVKDRN